MQELFTGICGIMLYFIVCASLALLLRFTKTVPDEIFRKILHGILLGSLSVWIFMFHTWWLVAATAVGFAILVYPILCLAEHLKGYSKVVTERKRGELKSSLLLVFFMFAVVVAVCWGYFGDKLLALASIYAWGFGDAAAALVGKKFGRHKIGKHKIGGKIVPGKKSVEGTLTMFLTSFVSVLLVLLLRGGMPWYVYLVTAFATALISAIVELYTDGGLDTVTCPVAAMAVLLPMVFFLGGLG